MRAGPAGDDEQGQVTLLIIGFAGILLMAIVVVIDASAAYLQRQGLDNLADGAALYGADLGSAGIYEQGLGDARLVQQEAAVGTPSATTSPGPTPARGSPASTSGCGSTRSVARSRCGWRRRSTSH